MNVKAELQQYKEIVESNEPFCIKAEAWYMMGLAYQELADFKKAFTCFKKAAELDYPDAFARWAMLICPGWELKRIRSRLANGIEKGLTSGK